MSWLTRCGLILGLFILLGSPALATPYSFLPEDDPQDSVVWQRVRQSLFGERPIQQASSQLLTLKVPARALDSAFVPVQVVAGPASGSVQTLYLIADANPSPLAAKIQFLALGMPVNFETRIRIDAYTHIRVVAETSDGQLFMATGFTKATGGCTAPATIDAQAALAHMGIMSFKVDPGSRSQGLRRVRWRMEHPNHSGFVMEQHTRLNIPADYVQSIQVQFNGEPVLSAEVDFSLSENPSLEFSLPSLKPGVLRVLALDSSGRRFEGRQALDQSSVQIVAPGVYAVMGDQTAHRGNAGFIVGPQGVMVIDSGASWAQGQDLIAKVRHITSLPIQLLLLTHAKDEFIFGATAFQELGIPVYMHQDAVRLMKARCATCLEQLQKRFGHDAMSHTRIPTVDVVLNGASHSSHTGRGVRLLTEGHTGSPGAMAVLDEQTGVMFAGAWLVTEQVPQLRDANVGKWLKALSPWLEEGQRLWVPGHGPVVRSEQAQQLRVYLQDAQTCVDQHLEQGTSLIDMDKACGQPAFAHWAQYDSQHSRNVVQLYLQNEREYLMAPEALKQ